MPFEGPLPRDLTARKTRKPDRFLLILETTTTEKVVLYQAVARALELPIQVRSVNEIFETFHAAEENTRTRVGNGFQKFEEADMKTRHLYDVTSPYHEHYLRLLREKCLEWDVQFNPARTFLATDDSTWEAPKRLWTFLKKSLIPFVPKTLLKSIGEKDGWAGPGAETGPVLAAAGVTRTIDLFRQAALEACHSCHSAKIRVGRTLVFRSLTDSVRGGDPTEMTRESILYLDAPNGLHEPLTSPDTFIPFLEHHFKANPADKAPIGDNLLKFHANSGPTGKILRQFFDLASVKEMDAGPDPESDEDMLVRVRASKQNFKTIRPDLTLTDKRAFNFEEALDLTHEFAGADVIEFMSFDANNEEVRQRNYYKLFSAVVAKQTDARFMNVPIIVHDDGCWTPAIELIFDLAKQGMSKDFIRSKYEGGPLVKNPAVEHIATGWLDIVRSKNIKARKRAAERIKTFRLKDFSRFRGPEGVPSTRDLLEYNDRPIVSHFKLKPENLFTVGIFTSASNDNHKLLNTLQKYSGFLQKLGTGICWGAGDRHAMGAIPEGALKAVKHPSALNWMAGLTTRIIAENETQEGKPPAVCHWPKLYSPTIYKRMADIIDVSDMLVVAPGGPGTVQEKLATLELIRAFPEMMKNKPIVLYMPDIHNDNKNAETLFWQNAVKCFWGDDFWERLRSNPRKGINGIYMATNLHELKDLTRRFKDDFDSQLSSEGLRPANSNIRKQKAAAYSA